MGRADDKEGEVLMSEADEEKDSDNDTSEADEDKDGEKNNSDVDDSDIDSRKKYKCTQPGCNAKFLRPSRLTWHLRKHNDERPYKCDKEGCDRAYTNSSHLKRHLNTTHKLVTKTYECKECGVEVGSLFSLKRHHKKIHDPTRLTCVECGAKFRKKHCYTEHLSMHAGVAMYKCVICNQDFTQMRLLKKHQKIHDSQKTYPCKSTGCTEVFDKWSKLNKHLETAHEFDHGCDKCPKKFKNKIQLKNHKALHTRGGTVMPCPYQNCPRFYCYLKNLDEHVQAFHLGRRFECDTCGKSFKYKSTVARHIQIVHEGTKNPASRRKKQRRRKDAGVHRKSMATKLAGIELPRKLEERVLRRSPRIRLDRTDKSPDGVKKIITGTSSSLTDPVESSMMESLEKFVEDCSNRYDREDTKKLPLVANESGRKTPQDVEECTKESLNTSGREDEKASSGFVKEVDKESSMAVDDCMEEIFETSGEDSENETVSALPSGEPMIDEEKIDMSVEENEDERESALLSGKLMIVDENFDIVVDENSDTVVDENFDTVVDENFDTVVEENEEELLSELLDDLENEASMTVAEKYVEASECEDRTVRSSLIDGLDNDTLGNARPIVLAQYGEESLVTSDQTYEKISLWLTTDSVDVSVPLIFKDSLNELS